MQSMSSAGSTAQVIPANANVLIVNIPNKIVRTAFAAIGSHNRKYRKARL